MTPESLARIIDERLGLWRGRLVADHATPLIVIGIRHARAGSLRVGGRVVITVDEPGMTNQMVAAFLREAAIGLDPNQRSAIA